MHRFILARVLFVGRRVVELVRPPDIILLRIFIVLHFLFFLDFIFEVADNILRSFKCSDVFEHFNLLAHLALLRHGLPKLLGAHAHQTQVQQLASLPLLLGTRLNRWV